MSEKVKIPFHFEVHIEELLYNPRSRRWHAQFMFYPHGYFRGQGRTPGAALSVAWRRFELELSPGRRWWTVVMAIRRPPAAKLPLPPPVPPSRRLR